MASILEISGNDWNESIVNIPPKLMNDYELALEKTPARYMYVCVVKGKRQQTLAKGISLERTDTANAQIPMPNNQLEMHPKESRKK